jgi:hypothetical protein
MRAKGGNRPSMMCDLLGSIGGSGGLLILIIVRGLLISSRSLAALGRLLLFVLAMQSLLACVTFGVQSGRGLDSSTAAPLRTHFFLGGWCHCSP